MLRAAITLTRSSLYRSSICISPARIRIPAEPYSHDASSGDNAATLLVVQPRLRPDSLLQAKLDEAVCLADSLGEIREEYFDHVVAVVKKVPEHIVVQNPSARGHRAHADTYFGGGTVENVKIHLNHVESKGDEVDAVFVNAMLSGVQQRNLEKLWGKPVLDRVGLIIEIFHAHASTKEGKLQAELAALMYKKTRLVRVRGDDGKLTFGAGGDTEVVSARGRGSGGRGFIGGAGETEINLQRRRISDRRKILMAQIEEVRRTRAVQRASRKRTGGLQGQGLPTVAIVGYTNAGKSTLVSALSDSPLFSDSRLFATVDPRLRNVVLPSGRKVLLSDTVGFISDLPVQLVEAFHATLEEVVEADLLVHVLDSTAPNLEEHRSTVLEVLEQIGVPLEKVDNMVEVWNKIDVQDSLIDGENSHISEEDEAETIDGEDDLESIGDGVKENDGSPEKELMEFDAVSGNLEPVEWSDQEDHHNHQINDDGSSVLAKSATNKPHREWSKDMDCSRDPDVKTSALKRTGLQELLELIDQKLKPENVVKRTDFDRKWRPPREGEDETGVAI